MILCPVLLGPYPYLSDPRNPSLLICARDCDVGQWRTWSCCCAAASWLSFLASEACRRSSSAITSSRLSAFSASSFSTSSTCKEKKKLTLTGSHKEPLAKMQPETVPLPHMQLLITSPVLFVTT